MKTRTIAVQFLVVCLLLSACAVKTLRPGSTDVADSHASAVLEQTARTIEGLKAQCPSAGGSPVVCPQSKKDAINKLIDVYNTSRKVWLTYHSAILSGLPGDKAELSTALIEVNSAVIRGLQ